MIDVDLLPGPPGSLLVRSFAACLASVTEVPPDQVADATADATAEDLPEAVRAWRGWLAGRGLGLVEVAEPRGFTMPGYWVAVLAAGDAADDLGEQAAVLVFGTPPGVVLSPGDPALLGRAAADLPVRRGFVLAALDPAAAAVPGGRGRLRGRVELVAVAERATGPMQVVPSARALAGHGLAGDRYARHAGTFTPTRRTTRGYDLTLVEAEALDALEADSGVRLPHAGARRNLVTRGIDLNALVGRRFRVGDVECLGQRLCEPCAHLERLTGPGVLRGLIHRGGLRADVLTDGTITPGATIETIDEP